MEEGELQTRVEQWTRLVDESALGHERTPGSLRVRFRGSAATRRELAALVDLEHECCSHLSWGVTRRGSELQLTVGGPDAELDGLRTLMKV